MEKENRISIVCFLSSDHFPGLSCSLDLSFNEDLTHPSYTFAQHIVPRNKKKKTVQLYLLKLSFFGEQVMLMWRLNLWKQHFGCHELAALLVPRSFCYGTICFPLWCDDKRKHGTDTLQTCVIALSPRWTVSKAPQPPHSARCRPRCRWHDSREGCNSWLNDRDDNVMINLSVQGKTPCYAIWIITFRITALIVYSISQKHDVAPQSQAVNHTKPQHDVVFQLRPTNLSDGYFSYLEPKRMACHSNQAVRSQLVA